MPLSKSRLFVKTFPHNFKQSQSVCLSVSHFHQKPTLSLTHTHTLSLSLTCTPHTHSLPNGTCTHIYELHPKTTDIFKPYQKLKRCFAKNRWLLPQDIFGRCMYICSEMQFVCFIITFMKTHNRDQVKLKHYKTRDATKTQWLSTEK